MPFEQTDTVPLGYSSSIVGAFSISIEAVDGDLTDQAIFIEDKETKTIHNLKSGPYKFNTQKGTFDERFVLRYTDKTLGSGDFEALENAVVVTIKNKQLRIHSAVEPIAKVFIYDLLGRELYKKERVNINELEIATNAQILVHKP